MNCIRKRFVRPERLKVRATSFKTIRKLEYWKARVIQCNESHVVPIDSRFSSEKHALQNKEVLIQSSLSKVTKKNSHTVGNKHEEGTN